MIHIQIAVETTMIVTSLQLINVASVVEEVTIPPESLRRQLPIFVLMMILLVMHSVILAHPGMIPSHQGVETMMMATSLQLMLVVFAEEVHLMISHPTKLVQLQLVASTMTLFQIDTETLALDGTMNIHLDVETTIPQNLPLLMSVALVEEEFMVVLAPLISFLVVPACPISQPQILLETPAPGTICTVELIVRALGMILTSLLNLSAALAVVATIDAEIKLISFAYILGLSN
jgi:hypothetical protein